MYKLLFNLKDATYEVESTIPRDFHSQFFPSS